MKKEMKGVDRRLDVYGGRDGMYALTPNGHHDVQLDIWEAGPGAVHVRATDAVTGATLYWLSFKSKGSARTVWNSRAADVLTGLANGRLEHATIIQSMYHGAVDLPPYLKTQG